jgi:hypothetical protein
VFVEQIVNLWQPPLLQEALNGWKQHWRGITFLTSLSSTMKRQASDKWPMCWFMQMTSNMHS